MPEATVIIPTYNRSEAMESTLESLDEMETSVDYEVIVVDDSDNEETADLCREHELEINYLRPEESKNLPHARNVGWKKAESDIIALVDDDVRFYNRWLDAIVGSFEEYEEAGAVGGPALEFEGGEPKNKIIRENTNQNIVTEEGFITDKSTRWVPKNQVKTDSLRGANMAFRRSVLEEIGGFDSGYIGNSFREDTDICVRVKDRGYEIIYNPEAKLEHLYLEEGGTRDKSKRFWYSLGYNQKRFLEKNFPDYKERHKKAFLFSWGYAPYSLMKLILTSLKNLEPERFAYLKGIW